MAADKAKSIAAMKTADAVDSRPHILVCSICQYGNGVRPPFAEDNLPELIQLMLAEPETRIRLVPYADWMMCAPCPYRAAGTNVCIHNRGSGGLPNQMRDLRVLRRLGLTFGTVMNACELYRMILECIPGNAEICAIPHGAPSVWYSGCGTITEDTENYLKGREELMALLG